MRIAIATDAWEPQINGVVTTMKRVIGYLKSKGHNILIIEPSQFRTMSLPTYKEIRVAIRPYGHARDILEMFRPDAVHVATEGPIGIAVRKWCCKNDLAFTSSYHAKFPEYLRARVPIPLSWSYRWIRNFHAPSKKVLVTTPSMKEELEERGFKNLEVWTRGVDAEMFQPVIWGIAGLPRLLYVGRVTVEKNIEAFLDLDLPTMKKVVVGDGPDRERLEKKYPEVTFTGYKRGEDLSRIYASAKCFVFPSRTDTFGLVMLEANACGVPVAAFPVTGPKDVIQQGVNGYMDEDLKVAVEKASRCVTSDCRAVALRHSWDECGRMFEASLVKI